MIAITVDNLSLSFGTTEILDSVSFSLDESDRLGIIGVNGCGKSTLFKLITGELDASEGNIYISKDKSIGILRQDDAFLDFSDGDKASTALEVMYRAFPELLLSEARLSELASMLHSGEIDERTQASLVAEYTALNEKFIADGGLEFRSRCASTLLKMGFDADMQNRPFSALSGGQRTRLALSRELCREPDILMLDEPTNHLDMETLGWLESFLSDYKKCLMVISHDRYFLDRVTNKTLSIEHHRAKLYNGGYTKSMAQRRVDREIEEKHYRNQQKEIARQEAYIARQRAWNRERNIIAAESRLKMLDKLERLERPKDDPKGIRLSFKYSGASGNEVLNVRTLSFAYPNSATLINSIDFTVRRGDRLFFVGPNGCGKSTLIKLLLGKLNPTSGYIEHGYNVNIGYYDQENQNLTLTSTVLEELWSAYPALTETEIRNTLALFRFTGEEVYKLVSELSGGERARLTLSKLILHGTNLLILDEPTNHLDIDSREALEGALEEYEGTVVIVSHDRYFIEKLSTRLIDMLPESMGGGFADISVMHRGEGYEELCRDRERRAAIFAGGSGATLQTASSGKELYLRKKKESADARNAQKRLERLRAEAARIENEIDGIDTRMAGEAAYDYKLLSELEEKKAALEERLLEIYEEI